MQKTKDAFSIFINEMGNHIFVLLSSLNREKGFLDEALFFFNSLPSFLRRKLAINTHESGDASDICIIASESIIKSSQEIDNSCLIWLSSYIQ